MSAEFKPDPASVLRAMASNYTARHCWDDLDVRACLMAADEIDRLRATPAPGAPGQEAAAVQAVGAEIIGWATHHEEPMLFPTWKEAAEYCNDDEEPIPLYAALPPSGAGEKTS